MYSCFHKFSRGPRSISGQDAIHTGSLVLNGSHAAELLQTVLPIRRSVVELRFDHIRSRDACLQRWRRIERDQLAMIHDGDTVAEPVSLVHVVSCDQDSELAMTL